MKINKLKVIGIIGTLLGLAATAISDYANDKQLDDKVENAVKKALETENN